MCFDRCVELGAVFLLTLVGFLTAATLCKKETRRKHAATFNFYLFLFLREPSRCPV